MSEHLCCVCPQLRPGEPRVYERPMVCQGCRSRLRSLLSELLEDYAMLGTQPSINAGMWVDEHGITHVDPVALGLPVGPIVSKSSQPMVSGSSASPLPLAVDPLDLTMPPPLRWVSDEHGDQTGHPSVASVLDSWARDWQTYAWALLPSPTVSALVGWLSDRLEWACDHHPAVDDFAAELRSLVGVVRSAAGLTRPKAEMKLGVPCRDCEKVTLYRWPGSDYVECGSCSVLMTPAEYERWTQLISAPEWRGWLGEIATRSVA